MKIISAILFLVGGFLIFTGGLAVKNAIDQNDVIGTPFGMIFGYAVVILGAIFWLLLIVLMTINFIRRRKATNI